MINFSVPFLGNTEDLSGENVEHEIQLALEDKSTIHVLFRQNFMLIDDGVQYTKCLAKVDLMPDGGAIIGPIINRPNPYWFLYKAYLECKKSKFKIGSSEF